MRATTLRASWAGNGWIWLKRGRCVALSSVLWRTTKGVDMSYLVMWGGHTMLMCSV